MQNPRNARRTRVAIAAVFLSAVSILAGAPAFSAPPPAGYPTQQVMATANNPSVANIPIRRGFWDADAAEGFGLDKAWHYHNITTVTGQVKVMMSPNVTLQGNGNYRLTAYANKQECVVRNGVRECTIVEEIPVVGVYNPDVKDTYFGWPVNGVLGMQTMYCDQGGAVKCPSWVWLSLQNIGIASDSARSADPGFSVESGLTAEQQIDQLENLETPEMLALEEQVLTGEVVLGGSYEPQS